MARVVLVPGLLCDETVWQPVLKRIPDAYVADLTTQNDLTQMAQDCLDRCPGDLYVVGHSMGARIAIEIARLAHERVKRLALMDTGVHPLKVGEFEKRAEIVAYAHEHGMEALAKRWLPRMVYKANRTNTSLMQTLTDMVLSKDPDLHERQITALLNRPDASAHLPNVTCSTLLVVGRHDEWSPVSQHEAMQALLDDSRLEIIENAGHFAPLEQPEVVADVLVSFLRNG